MENYTSGPLPSGIPKYQLEGELLEIVKYPAKVLKQIAEPVSEVTSETQTLVKNMLFTMYKAPGIGLAAPQVGISQRIFVMDVDFEREEVTNTEGVKDYRITNFNPQVFINPIIKNKKGETLYQEGCLSFPGVYEEVKRSEEISVEYLDINGNEVEINVNGLLAICIQHENDHLDGIVFLERLSLIKKNLLMKKYRKSKKPKKRLF